MERTRTGLDWLANKGVHPTPGAPTGLQPLLLALLGALARPYSRAGDCGDGKRNCCNSQNGGPLLNAFKKLSLAALTITMLSGCALPWAPTYHMDRNAKIAAAAAQGDVEKVRQMTNKNPQLTSKYCYGNIDTPLTAAARNGHIEVAELLLSRGADVSDRAQEALRVVADSEQEHVEMARFLLDHGADPKAGLRPAAFSGHEDIVKLLLDRGAPVDGNGPGEDGTPLYFAAASGSKAVFDLLIARGADRKAKAKNTTLLHKAAFGGNPELIEMLIAEGWDLTASDRGGRTPFDLAVESRHSGRLEAFKVFLKHGSSVSRKSYNGSEPLHFAAGSGSVDSVEALLSLGADVNAVDNMGKTPLHRAVKAYYNRVATIECLLRHGASVNARDKDGKTPLAYSLKGEFEPMEERTIRYKDAGEVLRLHGGTQ